MVLDILLIHQMLFNAGVASSIPYITQQITILIMSI